MGHGEGLAECIKPDFGKASHQDDRMNAVVVAKSCGFFPIFIFSFDQNGMELANPDVSAPFSFP
jgi:hypothetical protein